MVALYAYQGRCSNVVLTSELVLQLVVGGGGGAYAAHSLGANRFTPALIEASMRRFWLGLSTSSCSMMNESTVCTPCRMVVSFWVSL